MNISLFNKKYYMRRFGEQQETLGYLHYAFTDSVVELNVHPSSDDQLTALPEGERVVKRLDGHGSVPLIPSDSANGIKGDMLYYDSRWYECISCQKWDHTLLSHYNMKFVLIPTDGANKKDIVPPQVAGE